MEKIEDLLDLSLREVLEKFVAIQSLECCYYYGIAPVELIEKLFENYNIDEYAEAFNVQNLIDDELLVSYSDPILTYEKLERIMENLGISKKEKVERCIR